MSFTVLDTVYFWWNALYCRYVHLDRAMTQAPGLLHKIKLLFNVKFFHCRSSEEPQGWMGYFNQALKSSASYLPSQVSDMLNQDRAFSTARLPGSGLKNVCALSM
jgi:hypothetical protein